MQTNKLIADLIENPEKRKKFYAGYRLIIKDAMDHGHYVAAAEHKKTLRWLQSEIDLMAEDLSEAA